jgi:hypothetical protein
VDSLVDMFPDCWLGCDESKNGKEEQRWRILECQISINELAAGV